MNTTDPASVSALNTVDDNRKLALTQLLAVEDPSLIDVDPHCATHLTVGVGKHQEEYLVLTDAEAAAEVRVRIEDSLWAFDPSFIAEHSVLAIIPRGAALALIATCQQKCEDANPVLKALVVDMDKFVAHAVSADGRGHFLSPYDGKEHVVDVGWDTFYIYRVN